ncbi:hypothetical protein [Bacteroides sp. 519]|uniref:hypothetical protein n=1 Tax=Bacteroides sp. 519 TaxID=2302937 RepID=UPI0013D55EE2|nr:hypothetical protein [Bacteroides sp. 519]NDV57706.1 hypothetical protein [Bacteroides sp. 519]
MKRVNITKYLFLLIIMLCLSPQIVKSQSRFSLMPGIFYNGSFVREDVSGIGLIMGMEFMPKTNHFFSIELRTKYGYYSFDDGTKWSQDNDGYWEAPVNRGDPRLEYSLFSSQIGIVPKFYWHIDESVSLFVENEFASGLMSGRFKFKNKEKSKFTEPIFCYNIGIGAEFREKKHVFVGSLTFSTLNFRKNIKKHKPIGYNEYIPDQSVLFLVNFIYKIAL